MKDRVKILNIWVDPISREEARRRVSTILSNGTRPHVVFASNPEKNFSVPLDPVLYDAYRGADLLLPDGIGVVLAARLLYSLSIDRLAGSDFVYDICGLAAETGRPLFLYGAKEEVNRLAFENLQRQFPHLKMAGRANGYWKESEMDRLIERINESRAEILLLALGSPMQEKWFAAHKDKLEHVRLCQCIGGTLDVIAGRIRRAPKTWRRFNAEWLYRLITEPKRIRRQMLLPLFVLLIFKEVLRMKVRERQRSKGLAGWVARRVARVV